MPLSPNETQYAEYSEGISCHHCYDGRNDEQRKRYSERQKQMEIASQKGLTHIGGQ